MRVWWLSVLGLAACGGPSGVVDTGLAPFDPSLVIFADGCEPLPEAQACVDANPVQFEHSSARAAASVCEALGYSCCDPAQWISQQAAECIALQDERMPGVQVPLVSMACSTQVPGPMYQIYEEPLNGGDLIGVGVHAATGRLTWYDDGTGVFS
jgi:hypothetical protein